MASEVEQNPHRWWVLLGVSLGVLMGTIDGSIVNIALRTLVNDLNTTFAKVEWVVLSYLLVITALILGVARLGDMFGKKRIYTAGLVVFTIGSLLCGLAPNIDWLIAFRVFQGIGAVMVTALGAAIVTEVFPASERGRAVGIIGSAVSVGIAIGPSVGGVLLGLAGWRSIFLVNLPIGIVAVLIVSRFLPTAPSRPRQRQSFDFLGAVVMTVALMAFALAMTLGQTEGFGQPLILGLLGAALVGMIGFVAIEMRVREPMVNLNLFRNTLFSMSLLLGLLVFIVVSANGLVMPFFLEQGQGYTVSQAGLMMAVIPVVTAVIAPISGYLSDRFGPRQVSVVGLLLMTVGYLLVTTLRTDTSVLGYLLRIAPIGIGFGVFQSPNNSAVMGSVPRERLGVASGLLSLSRSLGQTAGLPLMGALFATVVMSHGGQQPETAAPEAIVAGMQSNAFIAATIMFGTLLLAVAALWFGRKAEAPAPIAKEEVLALGE